MLCREFQKKTLLHLGMWKQPKINPMVSLLGFWYRLRVVICFSLFFLRTLDRVTLWFFGNLYKGKQIVSTIYHPLQPDGQSLSGFVYMLISLVDQNYIWNNARAILCSELLLESIFHSRITDLWITFCNHSGPQKYFDPTWFQSAPKMVRAKFFLKVSHRRLQLAD